MLSAPPHSLFLPSSWAWLSRRGLQPWGHRLRCVPAHTPGRAQIHANAGAGCKGTRRVGKFGAEYAQHGALHAPKRPHQWLQPLPLVAIARQIQQHRWCAEQHRQLFDGKPRSDGYTHFKSAQGHSDSGTRFWYVLIAAVPSSLLLYYLSHLDRAPFTNRLRMIDLSRDKEIAMGAHDYRRLLASHPVLSSQHPATKLVQKVGARVAAAADLGYSWEFQVLDSPIVNAACLPGGKVVVYRGLLELFKYDESALAVVLAHEAGHVVARHAAEQLGFFNILLWAESLVNIVCSPSPSALDASFAACGVQTNLESDSQKYCES